MSATKALAAVVAVGTLAGCGQAPAPPHATTGAGMGIEHTALVLSQPPPTRPAIKPATTQSRTTVNLDYIDSSFAAGVVARPRQAMQSKFGRTLIENALKGTELKDATAEFSKQFGIEPENVQQIAVLVTEKSLAASMRIKLPTEGGAADANALAYKNQMKQIGLAFHNYHDVYGHFAPAKGKLSWRVHLLPFLDQGALYKQFALDEPWDSDTNKPLIAKLPEVLKSPGVKAAGKTALHVFVGKDAPFENENYGIDDTIDGTSLTILAALAGPDTAVEWTKPGGLKINEDDIWKTFGNLDSDLMVTMADGFVTTFTDDLEDNVMRALITNAGREVLDYSIVSGDASASGPEANPTIIAHCNTNIDQAKAVRTLGESYANPTKKKGNGKEYWDVGGYAIWFPDEKTLVATQTERLPRLMSNRKDDSQLRKILKAQGTADVVAIADPGAMPTVFAEMTKGAPLPGITNIEGGWQTIDVSSANKPLWRSSLTMANEQSATAMQGLAGGFMAMSVQQLDPTNAPPEMKGLMEQFVQLTKGRTIERDGKQLTYSIPKPANFDRAIDDMAPMFKKLGESARDSRRVADEMTEKNKLRQIALCFHNYHDVYNRFPMANGSTTKKKRSLSWRVLILPYLEEFELYERFELDEPWDSEHNKKLIAEMPDIFRVVGVEGEGQTSLHVIRGEGAPFGNGAETLRFRDIQDGSSNTILAVQAGPNKAVPWTKPSDLEFDPENPLGMLGNIGDRFMAVMFDGSVRSVSRNVDKKVLKGIMTHKANDGNYEELIDELREEDK